MQKLPTEGFILALKGSGYLVLSAIDWLMAKTMVSDRHYLLPSRVAREFYDAILASRRGQPRAPSLSACMHWNPRAFGPHRH